MQLFESASAHQTVRMYVLKGVNVLLFNYRGVGDSDGSLNRDGVVIDGETAIQYVHEGLGVPMDCILCHARSIGGGIANSVARLHPQVALCNERSFSSLIDVIRIVVRKFFGVFSPDTQDLEAKKSSCGYEMRRCGAAVVVWLAYSIGWDFKAEQHWRHVTGKKWLMYHPRDAVIPLEASLFNSVALQGARVDALRMPGEIDGHNRPLSEEEKEWHMGMVARAFDRNKRIYHADFNTVGYQNTDGQHSDGASVTTPHSLSHSMSQSVTMSQSEMMTTTDYGSIHTANDQLLAH